MSEASAALLETRAHEVLAPDSIVAGRYRVLGLLGTGGMGAVYRAEHVHMRKTVALKVLHRELLGVGEVVARFEREAVAAGRIEHPNVATATDFGKLDDGSFYLALEYVDGKSLRSLLAEGPLPEALALSMTRQITLALRAAHELQIVHRDLKPDNVMLISEADGSYRVKVLDFGIARVSLPGAAPDATHLTRVGVIMGTVAYMSPEQATGQDVDGRSDLYSLGVMLYEMISGRVPFEAELPTQVLARQITQAPPPLPATTPPRLAALVYDLLAKQPGARPPNADAVLARLAALDEAPAHRVTALLADRRKVSLVAGGGMVVLALLAWAGFSGTGSDETSAREPAPGGAPAPAGAARDATGAESTAQRRPAAQATSATPPPEAEATTAPGKAPAKAAKSSGTKRKASGSSSASESKRKTGPGGIYIPPPDTWFK